MKFVITRLNLRVKVNKVNAHTGNHFNDKADALAKQGMLEDEFSFDLKFLQQDTTLLS